MTHRDRGSLWVHDRGRPWTIHDPSRSPRTARRNPRSIRSTLAVATGVLLAAVVLVTAASAVHRASPELGSLLGREAGPLPDPTAIPVQSAWRTDAGDPSASPDDDFAVGSFAYGDPLAHVTRALGAPAQQWTEDQELVSGTTLVSAWDLDGGSLVVEALPDDPHLVEFVELRLDPSTDLRVALGRGLVAGSSTLAEAVAAWQAEPDPYVMPGADGSGTDAVTHWVHGVSWGSCDGPYPMVVFFGHRVAAPAGSTYDSPPPPFDTTLLAQPFTDVRFTWADAAPETSGCHGASPGSALQG